MRRGTPPVLEFHRAVHRRRTYAVRTMDRQRTDDNDGKHMRFTTYASMAAAYRPPLNPSTTGTEKSRNWAETIPVEQFGRIFYYYYYFYYSEILSLPALRRAIKKKKKKIITPNNGKPVSGGGFNYFSTERATHAVAYTKISQNVPGTWPV